MYKYNTDSQMWVKDTDTLSKDNYDNLKQDLQKLQLYSRALSGATYLYTSTTASIYEELKFKDNSTWFVSPASSIYNSLSTLPIDGTPINSENLSTFNNYTEEYGFTLKNFFTPNRAIADLNIYNVSAATTGEINLNSGTFSLIDGVFLQEGNLILVKDQVSTVDLSYSFNPDDYFDVNYYPISNNVADITYEYYNEENGIYKVVNGSLVKQVLMTYSLIDNLSVYVKFGDTYGDKQFSLSRKKNGFFPVEGEPFEFKSSKNYLIRNQVDYHNLFESNYYDVLKHNTQTLTIEGFNYTIPERLLYIGEFGIILNLQSLTYSQYVYNPYKETLRSITQTSEYYWMCGNNGTILKMSKLDFNITKIDLGKEFRQFMSISFIDDLNGIAVGKFNTIYYTKDGGWTWKQLNIGQENWSFNKCLYYTYNLIFLAGENGLFGKLNYSDISGFTFQQINLVKNLSLTDTYDLIQDINDMYYTHFDTYEYGWGLTYATAVDLMAGNGITYSMDCLFMVTNNSNILCYEINNFVTEHGVLYLSFSQSLGDLTSITRQTGTNNMFVSGDNLIEFDINTFKYVSTTSNLITGTSFSIISNDYSNKLLDYNGVDLYNVGNFALINDYNYASMSYTPIETETVKSKMLFMEYDMADKLNFFDSNYDYRLPNSVTFSSYNGLISSTISQIEFKFSNKSWLSYLSDTYKTYGVNSNTSTGNISSLSTKFNLGLDSLTYSSSEISINYNDFSSLYPIISGSNSRYATFTAVAPSNSYKLFIYKYITIIKTTNNFCSIGDIILLSNEHVSATIMINKLFVSGSNFYYYAFNDMNQSMVNSIKNDGLVTLTNLNKYSNYENLRINFEKHPISDAYRLSYDTDKVIKIESRFNNLTAYKSLETDLYIKYQDEYINTYVGATGAGYVDGNTSVAKIFEPVIVTYANNSLYFSEGFDAGLGIYGTGSTKIRVRKVDLTTNQVTTIAGLTYSATNGDGGLAINAALNNPLGIDLDSHNNIYIAECNGHRIRKIDAKTGIITTICGTGILGSNGDGGLAINARINSPFGLAIDSNDNIYFVETSTKKLRKITTDGKIWTVAQISTSYVLNYITIDKNDNVYLSNGNYIRKFTPTGLTYGVTIPFIGNGSIGFSGENVGTASAINYSGGICVDSNDNILFGEDIPTRRLRKYNAETGLITTIAGGTLYTTDGHPPLQTIIQALGITLDKEDNFYFADYVNSRIRKIKFNYISESKYNSNTFDLFGYTPKYNLLTYLSSINSVFNSSKKFFTMPEYTGLPCNGGGSFTADNIYYDANKPIVGTISFAKNKLIFGDNLKYEFDTFWINTFVDLTLNTNVGSFTKTQTLITDKYYDSTYGGWALEFSDSIIKADDGTIYYDILLNSINIISRNTLGQISDDLDLFNNLNKPLSTKIYNSGSWYFDFYDNPIKTKINTDSYTKILLSDREIKKYVSAIIYTNSDNILSMNVLQTPSLEEININNTFVSDSKLALNTSSLTQVNGTFLGYLNFIGGTGSSQELNPSYIGIKSITKIDDYDAIVSTNYLNPTSVTDIGILKFYNFDPSFNYAPINLLEVTDNKKFKIPTLLSYNNILEIGNTFSLIGNISTPTFKLTDSLDIDTIANKYHWILEAEIQDAIIGQNNNGIIWYKGIWNTGRWFGENWYSGTWLSGDWYSGNWYSYDVVEKVNSMEVGKSSYNKSNSIWYNGRWFSGSWNLGTWYNGRWYSGQWSNGTWYNGIWNDGNWTTGMFSGGIWVRGNWYAGQFNSFNKPAYWIDGSFYSGDFQNGIWYNGAFGLSFSTNNKFGSLASNSRNAIWQGGVWSSGNFYSYENKVGATIVPSTIHKYSQWKTGIFNSGNFYGGIVYNIEFNSGKWNSGIVLDIEIIGVNLTTNVITLNGIFRFNINDYINILEDGTYTPYLGLGNYDNPGRYRVALVEYDYTKEWTFLTLNYNLNTLGVSGTYSATASYNIDTGIRLVSKFTKIDWQNGIWYNGIYDGGNFYGGMWYNGIFLNGSWGI